MSDTFNMSGNFSGAIINIKSTLANVTQTVGTLPNAEPSDKDKLKQLLEQLNQALQEIPSAKEEEAEAVAEAAKMLVETANKERPNKAMVQITGEGLKKAAENIAGVIPSVLVIATQIVKVVTGLVS